MKPMLQRCERCGLREVRHELERKGIVARFCDECYWGEVTETEAPPERKADGTAPSERKPQ